jgi:peptidoglycan/xylan/chitin deacetylase (PgdA/CDA1 family)
MRVPGVKAAKTITRWIQARLLGGAVILGYHRVADVTSDEYEVCVTPKHFAEHMQALNQFAHPLSLARLVKCLKEGSLPPRAVVVTFDDGYADTLNEAQPILERHAIPATVFVCTGYAGREFWWDELERLVMSSQTQLGALQLEVGKKQFVWNRVETAHLKARRDFRLALYNFLLHLTVEEQHQAMDAIRSWSGQPAKATARALTHEELWQLADHGLIEIGAHTRHHPMLDRLSRDQQQEEIFGSKKDLEELLGPRVVGFSYPHGRATENTKRIVRDAGFTFACTSFQDVVRSTHDLYELPRFWQKDVDGDRFLQSLRLWMTSGRS